MDKKDFSSGECWGGGDTRYLQLELGKILAAALATVVELQPSDPIEVLALWLRNYRELNPLPATPADHEDSMNVENSAVNTQSHDDIVCSIKNCIVMDFSRDHMEETDYSNVGEAVHSDIIPAFGEIGDLFDDDDLG